ncbi:GAF domain-containing protein [Francisellaceae bacterium]|nr:GAF domain-containing protein [Francisellaceae bacterium]
MNSLKYKILYLKIDSDEAVLIEELLFKEGLFAEVSTVLNKQEYQQSLSENQFDVILCDNNIIDHSFSEALSFAKENYALTPLIIVTKLLDTKKALELLKQGATDYILKADIEKLPVLLYRVIEDSRIKKQYLQQSTIQSELLSQSNCFYFSLNEDLKIDYYLNGLISDEKVATQYFLNRQLVSILDLSDFSAFKELNAFVKSQATEITLDYKVAEFLVEEETWVKLHLKRQKDGFIGSMFDVTPLKNAELKLEYSVTRLRLIHECTSIAADAESLESALQKCINLICHIINWPAGYVFLVDNGNIASSKISFTADYPDLSNFISDLNSAQLKDQLSLPQHVVETKKPAWVADMVKNGEGILEIICQTAHIHGVVGFPIIIDDEVIAVVTLFVYETQIKNDHLLEAFGVLGEHIGHVLKRIQVERKLENLALKNAEIGTWSLYAHTKKASLDAITRDIFGIKPSDKGINNYA